jgi:hypothetical protein
MESWFKVVRPHDDIRAGNLAESVFAANLAQVERNDGPEVYRNPDMFFAKTYFTQGMRNLARQVIRGKIGTMSTNWLHYLLAGRGNSSLIPLWEFHTLVEVAEKYFPDIHKRLMSYKKDTWKMQDTLFEVFAARWLNHNGALIAVETKLDNQIQVLDGICSINDRHFIYECQKLRSVSMDTIKALLAAQVCFAQYLNNVKYAAPVSCVVMIKQNPKKAKNAVISSLRKFFTSQKFKTGKFQEQTITTPDFEIIIAHFTYGMEASKTFKNNIPRVHMDIIPPNKLNKEGLSYHQVRFRTDFTLTQDYINERFIEHIKKKRKQHRKTGTNQGYSSLILSILMT